MARLTYIKTQMHKEMDRVKRALLCIYFVNAPQEMATNIFTTAVISLTDRFHYPISPVRPQSFIERNNKLNKGKLQ